MTRDHLTPNSAALEAAIEQATEQAARSHIRELSRRDLANLLRTQADILERGSDPTGTLKRMSGLTLAALAFHIGALRSPVRPTPTPAHITAAKMGNLQ